MKVLFGLLLIILGIVIGAYLGIWVMFIGGIVQIIEAVKTIPIPAIEIAIGIAKIMFASLVGWLGGIIPVVVGTALIND